MNGSTTLCIILLALAIIIGCVQSTFMRRDTAALEIRVQTLESHQPSTPAPERALDPSKARETGK